MGGFTNVLGHAAAGFEEARQIDQQRQFEDAQARRKQHLDILGRLAADDSLHPDLRNWAMQEALTGAQAPYDKKWEPGYKNMPAPPAGGGKQITQPTQSFTPPAPMPTPPTGLGTTGPPIPQMPATAEFTPPAQPEYEGYIKSHAAQLQEATQATAALTGAKAGAEAKYPVFHRNPDGSLSQTFASGTGEEIGGKFEDVFSPAMMKNMASSFAPVHFYVGDNPTNLQPGIVDKLGIRGTPGAIYDQQGQLVPDAKILASSLLSKTTTESMAPSGAVTRKTTPGMQPSRPSAPGVSGGTQKGAGTGAGKSPGSAHVTSDTTTSWQNDQSPVAMAAKRWATQGQSPKGGPMAERQVLSYMKQHNLEPALPVPPSLQMKIQESFVARNSAIGLIDDVLKNSKVLDSLVSAGKIQIAFNPSTKAGIVTRAAGLSDQEAKVAGDYQQLIEHANLLRGPLGATGFRSEEAWEALQAQRGNLLSDPRITRQVLAGMRERLVGLNSADKMVLSGQGLSSTEPPTPPSATVGPHAVGDVIKLKSGKQIKITAIHPDGSFDGSEVK